MQHTGAQTPTPSLRAAIVAGGHGRVHGVFAQENSTFHIGLRTERAAQIRFRIQVSNRVRRQFSLIYTHGWRSMLYIVVYINCKCEQSFSTRILHAVWTGGPWHAECGVSQFAGQVCNHNHITASSHRFMQRVESGWLCSPMAV